jgi:hypothetical protein
MRVSRKIHSECWVSKQHREYIEIHDLERTLISIANVYLDA